MSMMKSTTRTLFAAMLLLVSSSCLTAFTPLTVTRQSSFQRRFIGTVQQSTKSSAAVADSSTKQQQQPRQAEKKGGSSMTGNSNNKNRGDARGAALLLENVSVYRGPAEILKGLDWRVEPRTKWALVGANGAGKSSLLKAIVGEITHEGKITVNTKEQVGYLQQTAVAGSNRTIFDEACSGMTEIQQAADAMQRAADSGDLEGLEKATVRFEAAGGYKQEQTVATVLKGLGFTQESYHSVRCNELSGGWQMRVAFARQLLRNPSLSLLDEPSNHLDAAAKTWLAKYLADYDGAGSMILVTHDVELLKSMDHIAEIIPGAAGLQIFKSCNYEQYLALKEERAAAAVSEYERNAEKAAKLQAFVDRFGASATKASAAQSRVKQLEKMQQQGMLDAPADAIVARTFRPTLILPPPPRAVGMTLLSLQGASIGYGDGKVLVSNVNLDIMKGMKILIRGPNGAGKSTCLHSIRGTLPLLAGVRKANPDMRLGMFTQDLAQELDPMARAVDLVTAYARTGLDGDITVSDQEARSALGRLGLQGEKPLRRICDLSGGEKARVALAMFAKKSSNVYLFDEISNHLDHMCVDAVSDALREWGVDKGAIVVVSHDRNFCDKIDFTHVATVKDGTFKLEERGARASDWVVEGLSSSATTGTGDEASSSNNAILSAKAPPTKEIDPKLRKQAYNAPKRIKKLESLIEEAETKISKLEEHMLANGNDVGKLVESAKEKESIRQKVEAYMAEWNELEAILTQVAAAA